MHDNGESVEPVSARAAASSHPPAGGGVEGGQEPAEVSSGTVAAALRSLGELDSQPLATHPEVYQRIHGDLQAALADIDGA